LYSNTQKSIIF